MQRSGMDSGTTGGDWRRRAHDMLNSVKAMLIVLALVILGVVLMLIPGSADSPGVNAIEYVLSAIFTIEVWPQTYL